VALEIEKAVAAGDTNMVKDRMAELEIQFEQLRKSMETKDLSCL
jgi:hypothetical protein